MIPRIAQMAALLASTIHSGWILRCDFVALALEITDFVSPIGK